MPAVGFAALHQKAYSYDSKRELFDIPDHALTHFPCETLNPRRILSATQDVAAIIMILTSKLQPPQLPAQLLPRDALQQRLGGIIRKPVTLVSAPPGFGKTTALAQFLHREQLPYLWYALDEQDNVPGIFWRYVCAGFESVFPKIGPRSARILSVDDDALNAVRSLLDELTQLGRTWRRPESMLVAIDDVHYLNDPALLQQLDYFLDHLPPYLHVALISRTIPALHIPRRQVRDSVLLLNAEHLRLSETEAPQFLQTRLGISLEASDMKKLHRLTEGWIGALQLYGLNLQSQPANRLLTLSAQPENVAAYLAEECFQQQDDWVQTGLLNLALVPLFNLQLANQLCPGLDAALLLETLLKRQLFLSETSADGAWYRFHDLLRDWLQLRNQDRPPGELQMLHGQAAQWYAEQSYFLEAMEQWTLAGDWEQTALCAGRALPEILRMGHYPLVARLLTKIPHEQLHRYPKLLVQRAFLQLTRMRFYEVETDLDLAERYVDAMLEQSQNAQTLAQLKRQYGLQESESVRELKCMIILGRSHIARMTDRPELATEQLEQTRDFLPEQDSPFTAWLFQGLGADEYIRGSLHAAQYLLMRALRSSRKYEEGFCLLATLSWLIPVLLQQGKLQFAKELLEEQQSWLESRHMHCLPNWGALHYLRLLILLELEQPEAANQELERLWDATDDRVMAVDRVYHKWGELALRLAQQDYLQAEKALNQLDAYFQQHFSQWNFVIPNPATLKVLLDALSGNPFPLAQWAAAYDTQAPIVNLQRQTIELMMYVRIRIYQQADELDILQERLKLIQQAGNLYFSINLLVLCCLNELAQARPSSAREFLSQAVNAAAPLGVRRPFQEEIAFLQPLLMDMTRRGHAATFISELMAYSPSQVRPQHGHSRYPLVEELSQRETTILNHLSAGRSNEEIAVALNIAASTVKTHLRNIYAKLGVRRRTQALAIARDKGLV
ncbi:hypothetical protein EUZ85_25815 [Hahella sp. KA22]|uniref:LuxR C-terminal-related transcriptional regulator n=1 Tax=Hahella sp. KA22 TaxID=1628392 RepID=UPI000FDE503C|nr:LuxR C-terminal-related transcriptional regulator [Hahella sp. KA22]AZZ93953.1 hypothetical protein ENC22_23230 [Hahella sp. KA22]QAY57327.1 hypothetical protein EUZ85_25815 [Hahella sp. KA22]